MIKLPCFVLFRLIIFGLSSACWGWQGKKGKMVHEMKTLPSVYRFFRCDVACEKDCIFGPELSFIKGPRNYTFESTSTTPCWWLV